MTILKQTLEQMPLMFSSNYFSIKAQKNGLDKYLVDQGVIAQYLEKTCIRLGRRRWQKRITVLENTAEPTPAEKLAEAIKLVKSYGYKVMKPVNEWVEL